LQRKRPAVHQSRRIARDEDEDLGRIVELECLQSEIAEDVLGNVIDKDDDQSEAAKEVEAEIALL